MVSDSISLPSLGSFHLSLAVLYAIGDWLVFRITRWSGCLQTRLHVSRLTLDTTRRNFNFVYGAITLCCVAFQQLLLLILLPHCSPNPRSKPGLSFSAFARRYWRNHTLFSFPLATEMFHFTRYFFVTLWIHVTIIYISIYWVSPFGNQRINRFLSAPRCFSQISTTFIVFQSQGIHHKLLVTYSNDHFGYLLDLIVI